MGFDDRNNGGNSPVSEKLAGAETGTDWVENYLNGLPNKPSGFLASSVIMIVTRLQGNGDGQLSKAEIVGEMETLGIEGFVAKYTPERRPSRETSTDTRRPNVETLQRATESRTTAASMTGGKPPFVRKSSDFAMAAVRLPIVGDNGEGRPTEEKPGELLKRTQEAAAEVQRVLTEGALSISTGSRGDESTNSPALNNETNNSSTEDK